MDAKKPGTEDFEAVAETLKQLCDAKRIRVFWLLCHEEYNVTALASVMEMSSPALSHHLRILKDAGLIISRKEKKEVFYKACDTEEARLMHRMIENIMKISCP